MTREWSWIINKKITKAISKWKQKDKTPWIAIIRKIINNRRKIIRNSKKKRKVQEID